MKHRLLLLMLIALLSACSSGGVDIGPTIADLEQIEELPPLPTPDELEPQATFQVSRQQVIDSFRALVEITADGGGTGDELRRLADLELESSLDKRISDDEATRLRGEEEALRAIGIYEAYLQKYPERDDNDKVLYQLSRAYALESETEKSIAALNRIAAEFPNSKYLEEVQFRRGEYLFVEREYEAAEAAYGAVVGKYSGQLNFKKTLQESGWTQLGQDDDIDNKTVEETYANLVEDYRDSLYFKKALYKYGWTQFKQGDFSAALSSYIRLLDVEQADNNVREIDFNPELSRADQELLADVVRVVSLAFSYEDDEFFISRYFDENGKRDYEPLLYLSLGELYLGKNRIVDGSDLFLAYTKQYPYSPHTPYFHQRAIETFQQAGYSDLVLKEKIAFVNRYDVNGEYWELQDEDTRQKLTRTLVVHLTELATHYHALARQSKKKSDYQVASRWYQRFLTSFPEDAEAPRMNFLLAESLFDAGQYPQAIDAYEKTAYAYAPHKDGAEAGYAALIAFDTLFKLSNASDVPALRRKRIQSAVRFTTTYPDDPRLSVVELQTAQQFFEWKEYPDAMASAQRLIDSPNVKPETKKMAWTLLSDAQFSTGDFAAAEKSYLTLLGFLPAQSEERAPVREQIAASIYKQGEIARDAGNHLLAAQNFIRLGQVVPESPKRIVADYDAATAYIQLEDWPASISQLEAFRKRYPNDRQFKDGVTEKLALAYSNNGNQTLAAREILALSKLPGTPERKRDLMWRAAELYDESGQTDRAIGIYKEYVEAYPYPLERSMELRHKVAEYYRARNDTRNLYVWLNNIVRADAQARSRSNARSKYLAATASLELVEPLHRSYKNAKLTIPLKTSLRKKKQLMEQSIDAYSKAIKYQVAEVTTEATFQIAEIYHDFAKSLMSSQRPKGLDEEQLEEYELLLEEQAFPFEEKAIDIHLTNFKRIPLGTYDEPTRKSLRVLGEMMPARFARAELTDAYVDIQ